MMKRFLTLIFLSIMIIIVFSGCYSKSSNNSVDIEKSIYNDLTDAPLSKSMPIPSNVNIAKCETGYYVLNGNKIYYVEQSTMDAIPLCNKPNCTHNNDSCNAILGNVRNIYYSDGFIYYLSDATEEKGFIGNYLVKMSPDGSTKENILYLELSPTDWTIHRNTFYYSVRVYQIDENTGLEDLANADCYIYSYSLDGKADPKKIYFAEEISENAQISSIMAFGNNLYFEMFGGCRYEKGEIFKTVKLSIEDNTCTDMITTEGYILTRPMYIDGHLLFSVFNSQSNLKCITDFDGNNPQLFWEIDSDKTIFSDGKYIYVDNFYVLDSTNDKDRFIEVYNINLNKVDEISLGNGSDRLCCLLPIDNEVFIVTDKDVYGDVIYYYDKGEIGTLNGKKWDKTYSYKEDNITKEANDNKIGALSDIEPVGSDELIELWRKAKNLEYGVKDSYQSDGVEVLGGFSVRIIWGGNGGTFTAYVPFMEFATEDKAIEYVKSNPYTLRKGNIVVNISVESVPQEVYDMLSSILDGAPIDPIDSKDFSGENFVFE